jgi:hypothetical protein
VFLPALHQACAFSLSPSRRRHNTFTLCHYFSSWEGSHREGCLANPSCTWLMGLLQGCTYLFWISLFKLLLNLFDIKKKLLVADYGFLNLYVQGGSNMTGMICV